jgi:hypothetical protein
MRLRIQGLLPFPAESCAAALLTAAFACALPAQTPAPAPSTSQAQPARSEIPAPPADKKLPRDHDKRRAAEVYLASSKLFLNRQFEQAMQGFDRAAQLDPSNPNYPLASNVARGHAVTALIQDAAKDRLLGNQSSARKHRGEPAS